MGNLKKILAVILTVVFLASMTVPALAAVENTEEALKLLAIGLMAGGPEDLNLDEDLNRIQGLTFAIRAAGKEAEALAMSESEVQSILAGVIDRDKIPNWANGYAQKYVAYAVKHKYTLGTDSTILPKVKFGPMDSISGTSFMVFLMKSGMGYKDVHTGNVVDEAIDAQVLTASQAIIYGKKPELIRDDAAGILYTAAMTGVNADGRKLIESLIESGFVKKLDAINSGFMIEETTTMTAKAIGVRKIEVQFSRPVDISKANIEVTRGYTKPSVKAITFSNDKKTALIEFNTDLPGGEYVVTVTDISDKVLKTTITIESSKLATIEFVSDVAIKKGNDVTVRVIGKNQYGEDITPRLNSCTVFAVPEGGSVSILNGVVTVRGVNSDTFKVDSYIVITVVDSITGLSAANRFKIAASASVTTISFGEITSDDKDYRNSTIDVTAMTTNAHRYYLPISLTDQYGNALKAEDIGNIQVYSTNPEILRLDDIPIVNHKDKGTIIKFKDTGKEISGTVLIVVVAPSTGANASKTIEVLSNPKIDKVFLSTPSSVIKQGSQIVLPITVIDIYNNAVPLKDIEFSGSGSTLILNKSTFLTANGATFSVEKNYATGVTNIMITPTSKNIVITATTATNNFQHLNLTALEASIPTNIYGIKSDFASVLANDSGLSTKLEGKVIFADQYGEEVSAPVYRSSKVNSSSHYYVITKKSSSGYTVFDANQGTIYATSNAGTDTYVIELLDKKANIIDSREVDITIIKASDIISYGIDDLNKFYTDASGAPTHKQTIRIHGLYDGRKVVINQNMITNITATNGLTGFNSNTGVYTPLSINTNGNDKSSTITVYVNNGDSLIPITKGVVFSDAMPLAKAVTVKYDGATINTDSIQIPYSELSNKFLLDIGSGDKSKLLISAKDQYGVERPISAYTFVVTGVTTKGDVNAIGYASGFTSVDRGKTFDLNVFIDNIYKSLKITIE